MIRLLAIADHSSHYLEQRLSTSPSRDHKIDYLLSCGDLQHGYLDRLSSYTNLPLYYVNGNHDFILPSDEQQFGIDLHARMVETDDLILCGFAGTNWYKQDHYQFNENQMHRITQLVRLKLKLNQIKNTLLKHKTNKPIIVLSHATPLGIHDRNNATPGGFKCFLNFIKVVQPLLWLHGHVHLQSFNQIQQTHLYQTLITNVYEFKYITVTSNKIDISYKF